MAKRPIKEKQLRRLRKKINRRALPAWIDLIWWLKFHRYADTTGQAIKLLIDGKVRSESHVVGRVRGTRIVGTREVEIWEPQPRVPASMRDTLHVSP